jgi:tetratricopeptide (TPR) repeat protein
VLGYHLLNIALHLSAVCLFVSVLRRLAVPGAWLAGAIFALHPVNVETVAWITEQKNTLSLVLYLLAALAYLRFDRDRRFRFYLLALGLFLLALGCKTVTATLPAALLVVFWWRRGRLSWRNDIVPLLPWFALGTLAGLFTALVERKLIGAEGAGFELSALERGLLAGRVVWFYLAKLFWPTDLTFIYPRWDVSAGALWQYEFPLAALAVLIGLVVWRRRYPGLLAAWLLFAGSLFPVLGFFNVYPFIFSFVADHFVYLPSLGIIAVAAAGIAGWLIRIPVRWAWWVPAVLLGGLGILTWRQSHIYRDVETLYRTTIARNPGCWLAYNNLGLELHSAGRDDEAVDCFEQALRLRPERDDVHNNLAVAFAALGRFPEAITHYEAVLRRWPDSSEAHNNLALALANVGRAKEALAHYGSAMQCSNLRPEIWCDWAFIFDQAGRFDDAIRCSERAIALGVRTAEAHGHWGVALANQSKLDEAIVHLRAALEVRVGDAMLWNNLGKCLQLVGQPSEAVGAYEAALKAKPDFPEILNNLGLALHAIGRTEEAIARFEAVVRVVPDATATLYNLALCLREVGRVDEAKRHHARARQLDPHVPEIDWGK